MWFSVNRCLHSLRNSDVFPRTGRFKVVTLICLQDQPGQGQKRHSQYRPFLCGASHLTSGILNRRRIQLSRPPQKIFAVRCGFWAFSKSRLHPVATEVFHCPELILNMSIPSPSTLITSGNNIKGLRQILPRAPQDNRPRRSPPLLKAVVPRKKSVLAACEACRRRKCKASNSSLLSGAALPSSGSWPWDAVAK